MAKIIPLRVTLSDLSRIAQQHEGTCLSSDEELSESGRVRLRCKDGHVWQALPQRIVAGAWCPICNPARKNPRYTIHDIKMLAAKRGGECLSDSYVNSRMALRWRCKVGHIWETNASAVVQGHWCHKCGVEKCIQQLRLSLDELHELAKERGGKCLAANYRNKDERVPWQCAEGHTWSSTTGSVKAGHWCPVCAGTIIDTIENMRRIAGQRGGLCLSPEYVPGNARLKWQCANLHVWFTTGNKIRRGSWCPKCAAVENGKKLRSTIERVQKIAEKQGGRCLSKEYVNSITPLEWQCSEGHRWMARPNNVKQGTWCPDCSEKSWRKKTLLTIEQMQEIAKSRGGRCISNVYVSNKRKLLWECEDGHRWSAQGATVKSGSWCPTCANEARRGKKRAA